VEHGPQSNQADKIRTGSSSALPLGHAICRDNQSSAQNLMPLKVLAGSFVFLCRGLCRERAEIFYFVRRRIFFRHYNRYLPDPDVLIMRHSAGRLHRVWWAM
jgi:hypothetical protein